ncbi:MAG: cytochrome b/b6 domain-containing protein [Steroidobacteraceae bacterium]
MTASIANAAQAASPDAAALESSPTRRVRVWDLPVRVFHWALVAAFGAAYLLSESERQRDLHVMFGYTVLGLVAFRLLWGFVGTHYARFSSFLFGPRATLQYLVGLVSGRAERHLGHNPAGSWAIWAILGLAAATGVTGYMTFNELGGEAVEEIHEALANAWLVVVFVHVAGVIASSVMHRENLVRAMVTGYKQATAGASVPAVPARHAVGLLAALAVVGFWIYCSLTGGVPGAGAAGGADAGQAAMAQDGDGDDD